MIELDIVCFRALFFAFVRNSGYEREEREIYQRERYQIGLSFCDVFGLLTTDRRTSVCQPE